MVTELEKIGLQVDHIPQGTFYLWVNLSNLQCPLNDSITFFELGLRHKVWSTFLWSYLWFFATFLWLHFFFA